MANLGASDVAPQTTSLPTAHKNQTTDEEKAKREVVEVEVVAAEVVEAPAVTTTSVLRSRLSMATALQIRLPQTKGSSISNSSSPRTQESKQTKIHHSRKA